MLEQARQQAREQGYGGVLGGIDNPPIVPKGVSTPETGGDLGQLVRESLVDAPAVRKLQTPDISEEKSARVRAAAQAERDAGGGTAGYIAAGRHLEGAYGREFFDKLKHLTPDEVDQLNRVVDKAPLQFFERRHAKRAILNMVDHGVVPQPHDQSILERVFGKVEGSAQAEDPQTRLAQVWDKFVQVANIPRALRSSMDISAPFRQGLMVLVTHPGVFAKSFGKMLRQFASEDYYQLSHEAILAHPDYPLAHKYGVPFTGVHTKTGLSEEEMIGAQLIDKGRHNPIRMSERAFVGFQNECRMGIFSEMMEKAALMGEDVVGNDKLGHSIARLAGTFTGRGVTPKLLEGHLLTMSRLLFSPRLMAARLNMLSPVYYYKLDPFARREALAGLRNITAAVVSTMAVAKLLGAEVEFDPRSSNFAKVKVGNTRVDITGGFSQYIRYAMQYMLGMKITSAGTRIPVKRVGQHVGPKDISTLDMLTQFTRSKAAPVPAMVWDEFAGSDYLGRPLNQLHELGGNAPFIVQDTRDAYQKSGPGGAIIAAVLGAVGFGVQSYKDTPPPSGGGLDLSGGLGSNLDLSGGLGP